MGKRLFVGNLSFNTTEMALREAFEGVGQIVEAKIVMDRETGRPRGFAFIEMSSDEEARAAIETLDGREVDGRNINVKEAMDRPSGGGGGGGRGGFSPRGGDGGGGGGRPGGGGRGGRRW